MQHSFKRTASMVVVMALAPLVLIAAAALGTRTSIPDMTRDIAAIAQLPPLTGFLSSLGILLWAASCAVWLFTAALVRGHRQDRGLSFFTASGLLSGYLGLDDLFQFHEVLSSRYLQVSERGVYVLLGCAVLAYLGCYRRQLARRDGLWLLASLGLLSASVLCDKPLEAWLQRLADWSYLIEDGLKWAGILTWTTFACVRCAAELRVLLPRAGVALRFERVQPSRGDAASSGASKRLRSTPS